MRQTTITNKQQVTKKWYLVDCKNLVLGRMATEISLILRGKKKATFTPHVDCGDNVIVINAQDVILTKDKLNKKLYYRHSGYPGGLRKRTAKEIQAKNPAYLVEHAVRLMLPKNRLGRQLFRNLFVYAGSDHKHEAQKPEKYEIPSAQQKEITV